MKIQDISTPALIVMEDVFNSNALQMNRLLDGKALKLRPHYKSHKCGEIARFQVKNGAIGLTCAKLDEAIDLVDNGVEDVLIANQIVDESKISKLAYLAKACKLTVCVDNVQNVLQLEKACALANSTLYIFIEYEIGMERCGVKTPENVLNLIKLINECKHLRFSGIQAYAGHISHEELLENRQTKTAENYTKLNELFSFLLDNGIEVKTLSGGSTGTSVVKTSGGLYTELQAGSYLFMDATYTNLDLPFENSLFILTTVVSVSDNITVVDAGVKSCGVDQGMPKCLGFSADKIVASEEHFQIHNPTKKFNVGDKLMLIPSHCCSTVNLHEKIYFIKGDKVSKRVLVTARGCCK